MHTKYIDLGKYRNLKVDLLSGGRIGVSVQGLGNFIGVKVKYPRNVNGKTFTLDQRYDSRLLEAFVRDGTFVNANGFVETICWRIFICLNIEGDSFSHAIPRYGFYCYRRLARGP